MPQNKPSIEKWQGNSVVKFNAENIFKVYVGILYLNFTKRKNRSRNKNIHALANDICYFWKNFSG